ncbi:MAG: DapH/DapD/GlmU-related protein [Candidatus Omnitrophota bacterium]
MVRAIVQGLIVVFLYFLGALVVGAAMAPALAALLNFIHVSADWLGFQRALALGIGIAAGFFFFGLTLMLLVGLLNMILGLRLKEGSFGFKDGELFKWFFLNALVQAVKAFFMDFMLLTPFANLFYRMMGAKLGLNVQINSKNVADLSLLEIGDNTVIGGNATVICHLFERKGLKLKKVKIGAHVVVGLNSVIMPGVDIGDHAIIAPGAIVPKGTIVPPRTVYAGQEHVHKEVRLCD